MDTVVFTIGTIATIAKLLLSSQPMPAVMILMGSLSLLLSSSHVLLLHTSEETYLKYRDNWAVAARLVRPMFALCSIPHLDIFPQGSTYRAIFLTLLSTGAIPLTCAIGIRLRFRHHLLVQAIVAAAYLQQGPSTCTTLLDFPAARTLFQLLMQLLLSACVGPVLEPTTPSTATPSWCCLSLHALAILLGGVLNTAYTVYHHELAARSRFASRLPTPAPAPEITAAAVPSSSSSGDCGCSN